MRKAINLMVATDRKGQGGVATVVSTYADCLTLKFGPRAEMANDIALYAGTLPIVVLLYALPSWHSAYSHVIKRKL